MFKKIINKLFGKPKEAISFRQGYDLTEMAVVTFYQGDKKFNFLLDSGSNSNVINSRILDKIEHIDLGKEGIMLGIEGNKKLVPICRIVLSYKNQNYSFEYLISDLKSTFDLIKKDTGVTLHGIIGTRFFNKYKYVLDFDELIAYSKQ